MFDIDIIFCNNKYVWLINTGKVLAGFPYPSPERGTTLSWWGSPDAPKASVESVGPFLDTRNYGWLGASGAKSLTVKENT